MSGFHPKDLIKEVKCRPGLYNKDLLEHPRREHKHQLWLEVGEKLTPKEDWKSYSDIEKDARVDEIQAKWKHLRDHFYREIKLVSSGEAHKKRKYVYFDEMEFMRPYVGFKLTPSNKSKVKYRDSLDEDENISQYYMEENDTDEVMEELLNDDERSESPEEPRRTRRSVKPSPKVQAQKAPAAAATTTPKFNKTPKDVIKNFDVLKKTSNGPSTTTATAAADPARQQPSFKIRDGDISFCLSLVPTFRKLGDSAKLRAKIEMLKILHKFVEQAEKSKQVTNARSGDLSQTDMDMQEDHLEELDETINVKHEENDDPLHGSSSGGNTKTWWT